MSMTVKLGTRTTFEWTTPQGTVTYDSETETWKLGKSVEGHTSVALARVLIAGIMTRGTPSVPPLGAPMVSNTEDNNG